MLLLVTFYAYRQLADSGSLALLVQDRPEDLYQDPLLILVPALFIVTAAMTLIMAHTAVAATLYPLLMAIYALYTDEEKPTRFGKGLFIGMAFVAGAGSIITLLGAARGAVAIGFYKEIVGRDIAFFELTYYMAPITLPWCPYSGYCA